MTDRKRWRRVPGWPGYKVSSAGGQVRSVDRVLANGTACGGLPLKLRPDKDGYLYVHLSDGRRRRRVAVHTLVLEAFVSARPDGMEACHGPGGHQVNDLVNLRWDSHLENERDKRREKGREREGKEGRKEGDGIEVTSRSFPAVSPVSGELRA